MSMLACLLFLIVACATAQVNEECPTWHWHSSTGCKCSSRLGGAILCVDQRQVHLRVDYCMTLDSSSNLTVAATCHRSYHDRQNTTRRGVYALLPNNSHQLQETQCTPNNRHGLLCAECIHGYGVSVTTLTPKCIDCSKHSPFIAALLYLTLELLPAHNCILCNNCHISHQYPVWTIDGLLHFLWSSCRYCKPIV